MKLYLKSFGRKYSLPRLIILISYYSIVYLHCAWCLVPFPLKELLGLFILFPDSGSRLFIVYMETKCFSQTHLADTQNQRSEVKPGRVPLAIKAARHCPFSLSAPRQARGSTVHRKNHCSYHIREATTSHGPMIWEPGETMQSESLPQKATHRHRLLSRRQSSV